MPVSLPPDALDALLRAAPLLAMGGTGLLLALLSHFSVRRARARLLWDMADGHQATPCPPLSPDSPQRPS